MFNKYLKDIGLSDKESAIYISLLSFEKASIIQLSQKAKVKRPTTYVILESLMNKGLVSETVIGKKTLYIAEPPEKLELFVERQIYLLEENKKSLGLVIPQLKGLQGKSEEKPIVQFFEGKEGVISLNNETFVNKTDNEPVYMVYSRDDVKNIFSEEESTAIRNKRVSKNIKSKAIYTSKLDTRPSDETGDRIKINDEKYPITSDITIYGDKVVIALLKGKVSGILIKNKYFSETLKSLIKYIFDKK